ncbi:hypothetical protein [Pontivivens ytuae]|uniref:Uncharacterized protein n=1 Tax=Pontivivens ytuae TaxID=2789856 RepID=A0A7S9LT02_9RHOB|nr:hypothetical protein [Pontivivens ytuae]QPH54702.1 hypothetical protein I0K15_02670 [Pontivivens ytuae]
MLEFLIGAIVVPLALILKLVATIRDAGPVGGAMIVAGIVLGILALAWIMRELGGRKIVRTASRSREYIGADELRSIRHSRMSRSAR